MDVLYVNSKAKTAPEPHIYPSPANHPKIESKASSRLSLAE